MECDFHVVLCRGQPATKKEKKWSLPSFSGVICWFLSVPLGIALPLCKKERNKEYCCSHKIHKILWDYVKALLDVLCVRMSILTCVGLGKLHCPLRCPPLPPHPDLHTHLRQGSGQTGPLTLRHQPACVPVLWEKRQSGMLGGWESVRQLNLWLHLSVYPLFQWISNDKELFKAPQLTLSPSTLTKVRVDKCVVLHSLYSE